MGVSKNSGTPKWMVKIIENPIYKMDDLGVPLFSETSTYANCHLISTLLNWVVILDKRSEKVCM